MTTAANGTKVSLWAIADLKRHHTQAPVTRHLEALKEAGWVAGVARPPATSYGSDEEAFAGLRIVTQATRPPKMAAAALTSMARCRAWV